MYVRGYANSVTLGVCNTSKSLMYTKSSLPPLIICILQTGQNLWIKSTEAQNKLNLRITVSLQAAAIQFEVCHYLRQFSWPPTQPASTQCSYSNSRARTLCPGTAEKVNSFKDNTK